MQSIKNPPIRLKRHGNELSLFSFRIKDIDCNATYFENKLNRRQSEV